MSLAALRDSLRRAVDQYRRDPLFCVPPAARVLREGGTAVVLGTTDFAAAFIHDAAGRVPILGAVDDYKAGKEAAFHGVDIIGSARLVELAAQNRGRNRDLVCVSGCRYDGSKRYFADLARRHGIPVVNYEQAVRLLGWRPARDHRLEDWGATIAERLDEYLAVADAFADDYSRETMLAVLLFHVTCDPEHYLGYARPYSTLYFRSGLFTPAPGEKLVDCGASIGETTMALIGITQGEFARSWMIEPDRYNVDTLTRLIRRYEGTPVGAKLALHPVAVGEAPASATFHHVGGHGGFVSATGAAGDVRVEPVDALVDDAPTLIKMDIEGFELPALRGARRTIGSARPKLAISAYHRATDLLEIPRFVDSLGVQYRMGLRHHTEDRWDTCLYFY